MQKVYIAGALTRLEDQKLNLKDFYTKIGHLCRSFGIEAFVPHEHFDPINHPDFTPKEVYQREFEEVTTADLMIAYVGEPSLGTGSEIEMAKNSNSTIILVSEKDKKVSRLVRGNPAVKYEVVFEDEDEALSQLKEILEKIK